MRNPFKRIITTLRTPNDKSKHPIKTIRETLNIFKLYERDKETVIDAITGSIISTSVTYRSILSNKRVHKHTMNCKTTTTVTTTKTKGNQIIEIIDSDCSDTITYEIEYFDNKGNTIQFITYEKNRNNDCIEMDTFTCENWVYDDKDQIIYKNAYTDRCISDTDIYVYDNLGRKRETVFLKSSLDLDENCVSIVNTSYTDDESSYTEISYINEYSNNSINNYRETKSYNCNHQLISSILYNETTKETISNRQIEYNIDGNKYEEYQNGKIIFKETYNDDGTVSNRIQNNGNTSITSEYEYDNYKDEKTGKDRYSVIVKTTIKTKKGNDEEIKYSVNKKIFNSKNKLLEDFSNNGDASIYINLYKY